MIEKYECEAVVYSSLKKTARWRDQVAARWPNDPRNRLAAERLRSLSQVALTDDQWAAIAPHFDTERWSEVLSDTCRSVGMKPGFSDFDAYAHKLIEALAR